MFRFFIKMNKNKEFSRLLFLTGLIHHIDFLVERLKEKNCDVSPAKIRRWRRDIDHPNSSPIPQIVFDKFWEILQELKDSDPSFCKVMPKQAIK